MMPDPVLSMITLYMAENELLLSSDFASDNHMRT